MPNETITHPIHQLFISIPVHFVPRSSTLSPSLSDSLQLTRETFGDNKHKKLPSRFCKRLLSAKRERPGSLKTIVSSWMTPRPRAKLKTPRTFGAHNRAVWGCQACKWIPLSRTEGCSWGGKRRRDVCLITERSFEWEGALKQWRDLNGEASGVGCERGFKRGRSRWGGKCFVNAEWLLKEGFSKLEEWIRTHYFSANTRIIINVINNNYFNQRLQWWSFLGTNVSLMCTKVCTILFVWHFVCCKTKYIFFIK